MKRKAILGTIFVTMLMILSANSIIQTYALGSQVKEQVYSISLSEPSFEEKEEYIRISLKEATSFLMETGKPILPVIVKTFTFPAGTEIKGINVKLNTEKYTLSKKIEPAPSPVILSDEPTVPNISPDEKVYNSEQPYPSKPYNTKIGVGLKDGQHVIFVNVRCTPQYSSATDTIYVPKKIDIKVRYKPPEKPLFTADQYDMLIITDEKFKPQLQKLVEHKNSIGIRTILETTQEIYPKYNGRDAPEDIKLRIKDAIEEWGIKYVLLAGGRKGQTFDWYIPERRTHNDADYESGYASDLYYADIYKYKDGKVEFEDWDSNGNGIFAEFSRWGEKKDIIDYYPDVYVGRLPIRYSWEAEIVVDKIITYENTASETWFKRAFVVGGDTSPPARDEHGVIKRGIYEGEIVADVAAGYLEKAGFSIDKLYTSKGNFNNYMDIVNQFNMGAGFAYLSGHGNPGVWGNFWPDAETEEEFSLGFTVFDIWKYANGYQLPIVVVGGCHNAQFNVTMQHIVAQNTEAIYRGEYYPHDGCSWMLLEEGGGSIASIGYTGYGYGYINEYCTMGLGGWIEPRFFHAYAIQGKTHLGEVHSQAITDYINIIDQVNYDQIDRKTIESWALLGDPSLKIGGIRTIPLGFSENKNNEYYNKPKADLSIQDVPTWEEGMTWTYKVSDFNFTLDEVEGRYISVKLSVGELVLKVTDVTADTYKAELKFSDGDINVDIDLDLGLESGPIKISGHLFGVSGDGYIYFDRANWGIKRIEGVITGNVDLSSLPINLSLPPFIEKLLSIIPFVIKINFDADFSESYPIIDFPLTIDKTWGLPAVNVSVDGTIKSFWFRVLNIVNIIARLFGMELIPPEIAKLLPVIDISKLLEVFGFPEEIPIPKIFDPLYHDIHPFKCASKEKISVEGGTFDAYDIQMVRAIGQMYYSPDAENIIKVKANFNDIVPIIKDFTIELTKFEK